MRTLLITNTPDCTDIRDYGADAAKAQREYDEYGVTDEDSITMIQLEDDAPFNLCICEDISAEHGVTIATKGGS